jgi:hypothetical protein
MDRRYYRLKALFVLVALAAALVSSLLGAPQIERSAARLHYGAAASVQASMADTSVKWSRAVGDFIRHRACMAQF